MVPVIKQSRWKKWCARHALSTTEALFALETCYYGFGWRTRPGTLLLTTSELIHQSYSWRDTFYAIFEPSIRITVPRSDISRIVQCQFSLSRRLFLSMPDACFQVVTRDGVTHDLVMQRSGKEFLDALSQSGFTVEHESRSA